MLLKGKMLVDLLQSEQAIFIYDGDCPFCSYFAELNELKNKIPTFSIINGRDNMELLLKLKDKGYNLKDGAILIHKNEILYGYKAIKWICSQMEPSDKLLKILFKVMKSNTRAKAIYPLLLLLRRFSLALNRKNLDPLSD
jgi:predicted DCC family thiol-disulfide oxidoreductase YuxK